MEQVSALAQHFPGLKSIYEACTTIYPDQPNPLQISSVIKCWLGGPDPLDYISMYSNPGDPDYNIPPHWHYVTFGLSDLHGDDRVHRRRTSQAKSGFGFELSFRLKKDDLDEVTPLWPANLLQSLAKYVFLSGNPLWVGDHVSWHRSLDGSSESRLQHMLMASDPQLEKLETPLGSVEFVQIVGITVEELQVVQNWTGTALLDLLKTELITGGPWLITDMRRGESILEINPALEERITEGIEKDGSNLSGVTTELSWTDDAWKLYNEAIVHYLSPDLQIKFNKAIDAQERVEEERKDDLSEAFDDLALAPPSSRSLKGFKGSRGLRNSLLLRSGPSDNLHLDNSLNLNDLAMSWSSTGEGGDLNPELEEIKYHESLHLRLTLEAGLVVPLALSGRVAHGRHFTFKSGSSDLAVTFVDNRVEGSWVDLDCPFASKCNWLQVLIEPKLQEEMLRDFEGLRKAEGVALPKTFLWPKWSFAITVH